MSGMPTMQCVLRHSWWVTGLLALAALLLALVVPHLLLWQAVLLGGWLVVAAIGVLSASGMRSPCHLRLLPDGRLQYADGDGWQTLALCDGSLALPWLVLLDVRLPEGRRRQWLVWRDAVPAETHRMLRVYVMWFRQTKTGTGESGLN